MKIECERDEVAFICVAATARAALPWSISFSIFSFESTPISCKPATYTPSFGSSLTSM